MKWIASLLIALSLAVGLVAAITAYVPRLDSIDADAGLTLNAPAGLNDQTPPGPLLNPTPTEDLTLTAERLETLKAAGVKRVRVKEFSFARWDLKWLFAASCVGLALGAWLLRRSVAAATPALQSEGGGALSPQAALQATLEDVRALAAKVDAATSNEARCELILMEIGRLQRTHLAAFVEARRSLIDRHGLGGYARIMDRFALGERQVNRAWSAAADKVAIEARACLGEASKAFDAALTLLR